MPTSIRTFSIAHALEYFKDEVKARSENIQDEVKVGNDNPKEEIKTNKENNLEEIKNNNNQNEEAKNNNNQNEEAKNNNNQNEETKNDNNPKEETKSNSDYKQNETGENNKNRQNRITKTNENKQLNYYAQQESGVWYGKGAEIFGLANKDINEKDFNNILNGKFSYTDNNKVIKVDLAKHSRNKEHSPGMEIGFSIPKSLSILAEIYGKEEITNALIQSTNNTLDYIQNNLIYTRTQENKEIKLEKTDNILVAKFMHHDSREKDPQLHFHALLMNIVADKEGKVKTAVFSELLNNKRFIDKIFDNEWQHILQERGYSFRDVRKVTQIAKEIDGITDNQIECYSKRRMEMEKTAKKNGTDLTNREGMQIIANNTRKEKDKTKTLEELRAEWKQQEKQLVGINKFNDISNNSLLNAKQPKEQLREQSEEQIKTLSKEQLKFISLDEITNNSILHLSERQTTFTQQELLSAIIQRSNGSHSLKNIEISLKNNKELISNTIEIVKYNKGVDAYYPILQSVYTTKTALDTEKNIVAIIQRGKNKFQRIYNGEEIREYKNNLAQKLDKNNLVPKLDKGDDRIETILKNKLLDISTDNIDSTNNNNKVLDRDLYSTLNDNQKHTVDFVLNSKDQFIAIQGYAGVGKTYAIKALNEKLSDKGIKLIGLAPTHSAVETLGEEVKVKTAGKEIEIETNTLQSFLLKNSGYANGRFGNDATVKNMQNKYKNTIILVDEASLISNKQMKDLLTIADVFKVRILLQGDHKQLDSVEAGTPFSNLIKNKIINHSELNYILRQRDEKIKQAVYDVVDGNIEKALDKLKKNDKVIELRSNSELADNNNLTNNNELKSNKDLNVDKYNVSNNNPQQLKKELVDKVVETYMSYSTEERNKTLIVTGSNEIRKEINDRIREIVKTENIHREQEKQKEVFSKIKDVGVVAKLKNEFEFKSFGEKNRKEIAKEIKDYFDKDGRIAERNGRSIGISNNGIKSSIMHGHWTNEKLQAFKGVKDIIKNGVEYNDWMKDGRKGIHALVEVEDKRYMAVVQITESSDKRLDFYLHEVTSEEKLMELLSMQELTRSSANSIGYEEYIKNSLKSQDLNSIKIETLEIKSLTKQEKKELDNYNIGDKLIFTKDNTTIKVQKGEEYNVVSKNGNIVNIAVVGLAKDITHKNEDIIKLDISKYNTNFNVYEKTDKELVINDRIKWTENDKERGVVKDRSLIVKDITVKNTKNNKDNSNKTFITLLDTKTKKERILDTTNREDAKLLKHFDYDYVSTSYKSQGKTSGNVIMTLESYRTNLTNQKSLYVELSRTKDNVTIITDNLDRSKNRLLENTGERLGAMEVEKDNNKRDGKDDDRNEIKVERKSKVNDLEL